MLGEPAHRGSSRNCHLAHIKKFLDISGVVVEGRKSHLLQINQVLNPIYVAWVPNRKQWAYNGSLLLGHYLTLALHGKSPSPLGQDIQTLVITTADLCTLLGLGNRRVGQWRRGELPIADIPQDDQIDQYSKYYRFVSDIVKSITSSQMMLNQFKIDRWWALLETTATVEPTWRLATDTEQEAIGDLVTELLGEFNAKTLAVLFLRHQEAAFYTELNMRIKKLDGFSGVDQAWRVWWFRPGADTTEELTPEDHDELQLDNSVSIIRWSQGVGIDPEIIDMVTKRVLG